MRVFECRSEDGQLRGFEVENSLLSRRSVARVVASIPGVRVIRARSAWWGREDFCEFELNGVRLIAEEPFGDNSRYWIGSIEARHEAEVTLVRDRFLEVERPEWISSHLLVGVLLLYLGQSWMRNARADAPHEILSRAALMAALWWVAFLAGCVLIVSWAVGLKRGVYRSRVIKEIQPRNR